MTDLESSALPDDFEYDVPDEFFELEGEGELSDPALSLEAATKQMREAWKEWHCQRGSGKYAVVSFFGRQHPVAAPALDAFRALEQALKATGYQPGSGRWDVGTYNCRHIKDSSSDAAKDRQGIAHPTTRGWSLHAYGIAIDIDPNQNPFTKGEKYSGKIQAVHVDAVLGIKNTSGRAVWDWGGKWEPARDRMHFQLDQPPSAVTIDWSTVPDWEPVEVPGANHTVDVETSLNLRAQPTTSAAIVAKLSPGIEVAVQADAPVEANDLIWVKIKAPVAGKLGEGWVAKKYLKPIAGATSPAPVKTAKAAAQTVTGGGGAESQPGATHIVNTKRDDLNLRDEPSTTGTVLAELPKGSEVEVQVGATAHANDLDWVRVKAVSAGNVVDGWVAFKYLKAIG